jgi:DUF4097 and DUF4098 domain-containing protein YvlB
MMTLLRRYRKSLVVLVTALLFASAIAFAMSDNEGSSITADETSEQRVTSPIESDRFHIFGQQDAANSDSSNALNEFNASHRAPNFYE